MTPAPRVSIVTRTKNRPVLLRRAIASALAQALQSWEMLIVNDGGDREPVDRLVADAAAAAAGRIRVIHLAVSGGMEAASNRALDEAAGDYVVIHDDDDSWEPRFLDACVAHMDQADACVGGVVTQSTKVVEHLDGDDIVIERTEPYSATLTGITLMNMAIGNMFPPISFLYRRRVLDVVGRYDATLPVLGDWDFNLRFLAEFDIDVIPKALANYHLRPKTATGIYSNSVVGGLDLHRQYDTRLRNRLLRDDVRAGRTGLGFLVNSARLLNDSLWEIRRGQMLGETLARLRASGVTRFAVYGAGEVGRRLVTEARSSGFVVDRVVDRNRDLWGTPIDQATVVSLDQALEEGCDAFVIASLTFAREIRSAIGAASQARGLAPRVFQLDEAA